MVVPLLPEGGGTTEVSPPKTGDWCEMKLHPPMTNESLHQFHQFRLQVSSEDGGTYKFEFFSLWPGLDLSVKQESYSLRDYKHLLVKPATVIIPLLSHCSWFH